MATLIYAREDYANAPLSQWRCAKKKCTARPIKKVKSPNGVGRIALCKKHLEEHENGSKMYNDNAVPPPPWSVAVKKRYSDE